MLFLPGCRPNPLLLAWHALSGKELRSEGEQELPPSVEVLRQELGPTLRRDRVLPQGIDRLAAQFGLDAHRDLAVFLRRSVIHSTKQYENNCAESPTSRLGNASGRCGDSNLLIKRNDSCRCTDSSKTSSASAVTYRKRSINESYDVALSSPGTQ